MWRATTSTPEPAGKVMTRVSGCCGQSPPWASADPATLSRPAASQLRPCRHRDGRKVVVIEALPKYQLGGEKELQHCDHLLMPHRSLLMPLRAARKRRAGPDGLGETPVLKVSAPAAPLPIMARMTRSSQLLHPSREPAPLRQAATVLLLRDATGPDGRPGIEVLMTRRSMSASFAPGAYVFPGGGIDALDAASHAQARRRPGQSDLNLTRAIAAIRESFEELGVLLAWQAD